MMGVYLFILYKKIVEINRVNNCYQLILFGTIRFFLFLLMTRRTRSTRTPRFLAIFVEGVPCKCCSIIRRFVSSVNFLYPGLTLYVLTTGYFLTVPSAIVLDVYPGHVLTSIINNYINNCSNF